MAFSLLSKQSLSRCVRMHRPRQTNTTVGDRHHSLKLEGLLSGSEVLSLNEVRQVISNARGVSKRDIESVPDIWVHIRGGVQCVKSSCVQQEVPALGPGIMQEEYPVNQVAMHSKESLGARQCRAGGGECTPTCAWLTTCKTLTSSCSSRTCTQGRLRVGLLRSWMPSKWFSRIAAL
eukprot:1141681-Pelagomonas_calceolata.AAC.1